MKEIIAKPRLWKLSLKVCQALLVFNEESETRSGSEDNAKSFSETGVESEKDN